MGHRVFINYRGEDSHSYGALLYTDLARRFGKNNVFLDCESIPAGADFAEELLDRVRSAQVVLAVIGRHWLTTTDPTEPTRRRIDHPTDWIHRELAEAFAAGVRVIPVLTDHAALPAHTDLPADIALLSRCQARHLRRREPTTDLARIAADLTTLDPVLAAANTGVAGPSGESDRLAEVADQLAESVTTRWRREEQRRQIQDPFPIPVRWNIAPQALTDHWANIGRAPAGYTIDPLPLAGHLDHIAEVYRRVPSGRLVVLGRAGSGKTVLAMRLTLDLLATRNHADPIPVIVSIGSWNPTHVPFDRWLVAHLIRDHPGLAVTGPTGVTWAAALVATGRILPVVDGFDELAHGLHRPALFELNTVSGPLVMTSRPAEYIDAVTGTDVLTAAAGLELADLTLTDLIDYLPRTTRTTTIHDNQDGSFRTVWDPVLAELRDHPDRAASARLAAVLTTPLMVALARAIYSDTPDHHPAELLDTDRFPTSEALEAHLVANFIPAVYRHRRGDNPDQPGHHRREWDLDRVYHWLTYLAGHLHHLGTPDLAWWQVGATMRRSTRTLLVAAASGLVLAVAVALSGVGADWLALGSTYVFTHDGATTSAAASSVGIGGLVAFGVLSLLWDAKLISENAPHTPARVRIRIGVPRRRSRGRLLRRLAVGLGGGFGIGFGGHLGFAFDLGIPAGGLAIAVVVSVLEGLACGGITGLTFGLMAVFEVPIDVRSAAHPAELLHTNRVTVLFQLATWAIMFAVGIGVAVGLWGPITLGLMQDVTSRPLAGLLNGLVAAVIGGVGGGLGYAFSTTAWGRWVVIGRIWLPLTGRLPWALLTFLDDAHQRGVLRQAGAVYQFRHARLHDHLTSRPPSTVSIP